MNAVPFSFSPGAFVAPGIDWVNVHLHPVFAAISFAAEAVLDVVQAVMTVSPPVGMIAAVALLGWLVATWRAALVAVGALGLCWAMGVWTAAMQTLSLVIVAVVLAVAIAFPLGVWASRDRRVERALRPVLDVMQTVAPWVYLIPAVILFSLGRVPALIATVVYGAPPVLRLTTVALRQVPAPLRELGAATGATRSTILWKIELPSAKPTLLVGLNQCILLSLAMVVLAGLVGVGGRPVTGSGTSRERS